MKKSFRLFVVGSILYTLFLQDGVNGQVQPPPPPPTIWNLLGIPTTIDKIRAQVVNRRGNRSRLEKKPPLKTIGDPANLLAPNQAIRTAAEIKQQEDLKLQKIKALKFLASIGCGCYNKEGKVTKALIAGMNDCTEEVRLAAVQAISTAASGQQCEHCNSKNCCNDEIAEELVKIAYQYDDKGCMLEPSERVREAAKEALCICCPGGAPPIKPEEPETPEEEKKPEGGDDKKPEGSQEGAPAPPKSDTTYNIEPRELTPRSNRRTTTRSASVCSRRIPTSAPEMDDAIARFVPTHADDEEDAIGSPPTVTSSVRDMSLSQRPAPITRQVSASTAPAPVERPQPLYAESLRPSLPQVAPTHGAVAGVDLRSGTIHLHMEQNVQLPPGSVVRIQHADAQANGPAEVVIVDSQPGVANARPKFFGKALQIAIGDRIISYR